MLELFKPQEFVDKETFDLLGVHSLRLLDIRLKITIDALRQVLNMPMVINNWSTGGQFKDRCFRTQKSTTGAKDGGHYKGMAVDFDCYRNGVLVKADDVRLLIYRNMSKFPHIRCFEYDINWVHIDIMGQEDSDKRQGVTENKILLYSPEKGSRVVSRNEL